MLYESGGNIEHKSPCKTNSMKKYSLALILKVGSKVHVKSTYVTEVDYRKFKYKVE